MALGTPPTQVRRGYNDLVFTASDGAALKLRIFRDRTHRIRVRRRAAPAEEGQQARYRETAKVWRSWSRGAGFGIASDTNEGGFSHGSFLHARTDGLLGPAGYVETMTIPSGLVTFFNRSIELGGHLFYTTGGPDLVRIGNLVDQPVSAGIAIPSGQTQDAVLFADAVWLANGATTRITEFDGVIATPATDDVRRARLAVTNWVLGPTMSGGGMSTGAPYRILVGSGTGGVYHCSTSPGSSGSWVGPNVVGESTTFPIQRLFATSEAAFASGPDGVFMLQGGGRMPSLCPWWREQYSSSNGATATFYDGMVIAATLQTVEMLSADTDRLGQMQECQPGAYEASETSPVFGRATAVMQYDGWLVMAFSNGARSYVMYAKRAERLGLRSKNPLIWFGPEFECDGTIVDLRVVVPSSSSYPRLLYIAGSNGATPFLYRQEVPRAPTPYAAHRRGEAYRSYPIWSAIMSSEDLGDPDAPKVARFYGAVAEGLGEDHGANAVTITTSTDQSDTQVTQATLTNSPRDYAVADTTSARGHLVTVIATAHNDPSDPVWIRAIKMRGTIQDEKTTVVTVPVILSRGQPGNNGTDPLRDDRNTAVRLYGFLEEGPFQCSDWMGRDLLAVLEDIEEEEVEDADHAGVTRIANLTLSFMLSQARYGTARYGGSRYS